MEKKQIDELIECLSGDRTKFYYYKDRYALMLLSYFIGQGQPVHEIKRSYYRKLLEKPSVRKMLASIGTSRMTGSECSAYWPEKYQCYLLTLGKWGAKQRYGRFYNQTSRPGWNLVLQLNFSAEHNRAYQRLVEPDGPHPFHSNAHPIARDGNHTLAWARIDLDLDTGEALVEEIQTDWIRLAIKSLQTVSLYKNGKIPKQSWVPRYVKGLRCDAETLKKYMENDLKVHMDTWHEAMLASAVWFLVEEIGIKTIFFHTFESGCHLKRISDRKPPKSLYTRLPEKFCFRKSARVPSFLSNGNNRKMNAYLEGEKATFYSMVV